MNDLTKPQILVVNDDEIGRYATRRSLEQSGFRVVEAATGVEALELARSRPDLVLLDVALPDVDGFEVCRILKSDPETLRIPVLHLSAAFMDAPSQVRGLDSGADGYLTYPLDSAVLIATVRAHLRIREIEAERSELARLLQDVYEAIITLDRNLVVLSWNRGAERTYGWTPQEALGNVLPELVKSASIEFRKEEILGTLDARGRWEGELVHHHRNGSRLDILSSLTLVRQDGGNLERLVAVNRDITAQKRGEEERNRLIGELKTLNEELERRVAQRTSELTMTNLALQARTDELEALAYSISHDLRAPLRGVDGFSQVLVEDFAEDLAPQAKNYLVRIRQGAQRMGELIEHLLELSRLSRRQLDARSVDLSALALEVALKLQRDATGRELDFEIAPGMVVRGDEDLLRTVLGHLLSNAVKFSAPCETTRIEVGVAQTDGEHAYFVKDNGVGFDPQYAGRLFTAFQSLHPRSEFPGEGVGLATVRRIVHRHGGRVWAEGSTGEGATFYFTLPEGTDAAG